MHDPLHPDLPSRHEHWMRRALDLAATAGEMDEVPVGALVVYAPPVGPEEEDVGLTAERIVGEGYNQRETLSDPTAHAEMIALTQAAEALGSWRLEDCTLYVTLEPCPMCAGAIVNARVPAVVYGAADPKAGACDSLFRLTDDPRLNHRSAVLGGVLAGECGAILTDFFRAKRAMGKK
ncbi:tRNA adenosine(34) deaminase TadA [Alienimonas chondri]|uniref:tRNA-specific adenosine deaminase n=1 Tax=Alienimonas chondri TaxID=2681879 RepID=A0ABX1VEZ0_9PLAN|nr:tRNA adenosine(34) deaminase TadA [Alienimonas chondri]NNJ25838.1 tRNA-specific adenosine deaminase [Alienimonas chondri]